MKKKIVVSILLIVIMCLSIVLSGVSKPIDITLNQALIITRKLFDSHLEEGEKSPYGYMYANYIKGLDEKEDYVLVKCETGGYAIFERENLEIIEYSILGNSPYGDLSKEKVYYAGPTNYFVKENDDIAKNCITGQKISKEKMLNIASTVKNKLKVNRESRLNSIQKEENSKELIEEKNNASRSTVAQGVSENVNLKPADSYNVLSVRNISGYEFFINNKEHGLNNDSNNGRCVTVASQLLLAFNNWRHDGRLIPANPNENERFLPVLTDYDRAQVFGIKMRTTTSSKKEEDGIITFFEKLLYYIDDEANIFGESGETMRDAHRGITDYIKDYAPQCYDEITMRSTLLSTTLDNLGDCAVLRDEINNNRAVVASINILEEDEFLMYEKGGHAVVVYGYQNVKIGNQNLNGFIAHFGWSPDTVSNRNFSNVWFNSEWVGGFLTFQTSHVHNDISYTYNGFTDNHILVCTICGRTTTTSNHQYNTVIPTTEILHERICSCQRSYESPHNFMYIMDLDGFGEPDELQHRKICSSCGYEAHKEEHFYKAGNSKCWYCNYERSIE